MSIFSDDIRLLTRGLVHHTSLESMDHIMTRMGIPAAHTTAESDEKRLESRVNQASRPQQRFLARSLRRFSDNTTELAEALERLASDLEGADEKPTVPESHPVSADAGLGSPAGELNPASSPSHQRDQSALGHPNASMTTPNLADEHSSMAVFSHAPFSSSLEIGSNKAPFGASPERDAKATAITLTTREGAFLEPSSPPLTILLLAANPTGVPSLRLDDEVRRIDECLRRSQNRERIRLTHRWAATATDFRRALLEEMPTVVHFSGHGADGRGLVFESEGGRAVVIDTAALADTFALCVDHIQCVILNACFSEEQARAIHQHINIVTGCPAAVADEVAIEFSLGFYDAVFSGRGFRDAYKWGMAALSLAGLAESFNGAAPQLLYRESAQTSGTL